MKYCWGKMTERRLRVRTPIRMYGSVSARVVKGCPISMLMPYPARNAQVADGKACKESAMTQPRFETLNSEQQ